MARLAIGLAVLALVFLFSIDPFFKKLKDVIEEGVRDGILAADSEKERDRKRELEKSRI